jgi:hypothetical protein
MAFRTFRDGRGLRFAPMDRDVLDRLCHGKPPVLSSARYGLQADGVCSTLVLASGPVRGAARALRIKTALRVSQAGVVILSIGSERAPVVFGWVTEGLDSYLVH